METYLIVRTHAMATRLIPSQTIIQLAFAKSLKDVVSLLALTEYREYIDKIEELSARSLYKAIKKVMINRFGKLIDIATGKFKEFLIEYFRIFEIENILMVLGKKAVGETISEEELTHIPSLPFDYQRLLKAKDLEQAMKVLKETPPYNTIREEIVKTVLKLKTILPIEYELHRIRYERLFKLLRRYEFITVKESISRILGLEIDILNIFNVLATVIYNFTPEIVLQMIIPNGLLLDPKKLEKVALSKRKTEIIRLLKDYRDIVEQIMNRREVEAYTLAQKEIRRRFIKDRITNFTTFYDVLLYIKMCEYEFRDLSLIIHAIEYNIPRERVQAELINVP